MALLGWGLGNINIFMGIKLGWVFIRTKKFLIYTCSNTVLEPIVYLHLPKYGT